MQGRPVQCQSRERQEGWVHLSMSECKFLQSNRPRHYLRLRPPQVQDICAIRQVWDGWT